MAQTAKILRTVKGHNIEPTFIFNVLCDGSHMVSADVTEASGRVSEDAAMGGIVSAVAQLSHYTSDNTII